MPQLLHSCQSVAELAEVLGVPAVQFETSWGEVYGADITTHMAAPSVPMQEAQTSVGNVPPHAATPWKRAKMRREAQRSMRAARGIQAHTQAPTTELVPLQPDVIHRTKGFTGTNHAPMTRNR